MRKVWFWLAVLAGLAIAAAVIGSHVVTTVGRP